MSALATLLGTYAPGHVLGHEGKDYEFSRVDKARRVALEVAYFRRAREIVYAMKGELSAEEYERQLSEVSGEYRRGEYGFPGGESYQYYLSAGLPELVAQLTGCTPQDAERLCQERAVEVMHVVLCVVMESFPDVKKKALMTPDSPEMQELVTLLSATTNGSPSPSSTTPPASPSRASASPTTRDSPTPRSSSSTATPATTAAG